MATPLSEPLTFDVPATCAHLGPGFGVLAVALDRGVHVRVEAGTEPGVHLEGREDRRIDVRHDTVLRGLQGALIRFDVKPPDSLRITAEHDIPTATGLGTQTAGFAAGVGIAARLAEQPFDPDQALDLLVELGGDPAHGGAALIGGLTASCSISGLSERRRFRIVRQPLHDSWHFVFACPRTRVTTSDSRRVLPPTLPHAVASRTTGRLTGLLHALANGDETHLAALIADEVHVPFRRDLVPGMPAALTAGRDAGAAGVTVSGHGPSIVALTTSADLCDKIADAMRAAFDAADQEVETMSLKAVHSGALPQ